MEELNILSKKSQLREERRHKLNGWLVTSDKSRWVADDGRILRLDEFTFWSDNIKQAELSFFAQIDAEYEEAITRIEQQETI
jgi:hypothetical protein